MLPGGLQRMVLDFDDTHLDSRDTSWETSRHLRIHLSTADLFCPLHMFLHLTPETPEDGLRP